MSRDRTILLGVAFPRTPGFCAYCGEQLPNKRLKWCSDKCQSLAYIEANYGPWQRDLAKMRGFKCENCGKELNHNYGNANYDIHHIIPWAAGGTHKLDNLWVLCKDCHKDIHAAKTKIDEVQQGELFGGLT